MATLYAHCKLEADVCRTVARDPDITERMRVSLIKQAEKWEAVAEKLTVEEGARQVTDIDLLRLFDVKEVEPEPVASKDFTEDGAYDAGLEGEGDDQSW